jgi:ribosome-associated heat shock protein Hsp15
VDRPAAPVTQRIDVWLDIACLYRTRSMAQKACRAGRVDVNGTVARPDRALRVGDEVAIQRGPERRQTVVVRGFAARHVEKAVARALYEDRTPPPTPEELERRRWDRLLRAAAPPPPRSPDRRDRRALRRLKGRD